MSTKTKTFTFVTRLAAYGSNRPRLCLDAALATAVFEQSVNYLFLDDGVYQLLANQNADGIQQKTLGNALETLELYGIERVLVSEDALTTRGISPDELLLPATLVNDSDIKSLFADSDYVVNL